ncbi:hypothetical protein JCM14036_25430 [Desulfotomaculum defluvii]
MILKELKSRFFKILNIKDNPDKLAKSMSLGFGLALLPLPGINIPLGILLAKLLKLNIIATSAPALLLTYVSPFLYLLNYKTGAVFIKTSEKPPQDFVYDLTFWEKIVNFFAQAGPAYLLGSVINASLAAIVSYFTFLVIYKNARKLLSRRYGIKLNKHALNKFLGHIKNPQILERIRKKKIKL